MYRVKNGLKMKILQVNVVYKQGSTGKIVDDIKRYIEYRDVAVTVAYGTGNNIPSEENVYKFGNIWRTRFHNFLVRYGLLLQYGGNILSTRNLIRIIKRECPDIVHLHCLNGGCVNIYYLLNFLSKNKIATVVTHHAEFYYTGSCSYSFSCNKWQTKKCKGCEDVLRSTYSRTLDRTQEAWWRMYNAFNRFDSNLLVFAAVSPWVQERSLLSPIVNRYKCTVIKNGVETSIFHYSPNRRLLEQRIPNLKGKIALHTSASFRPNIPNHIKGGWYIVELAKQMPDVTFIIASIDNEITIKLPTNVFIWGQTQNQQELAILYSTADVTVIASRAETFSMICAESLCCGTPVAGFLAGGPESIAMLDVCKFVSYGNVSALSESVSQILRGTCDKYELANKAQSIYNKDNMAAGYLHLYNELLEGNNRD